jgi:uncharacterized protein (TIGR03086 family)
MLTAGTLFLIEDALGYALDSARRVTPDRLRTPTPCLEWNLFELLVHFHDVLDIFRVSLATARLDVDDVPVLPLEGDVGAAFRGKARQVLALLAAPAASLGSVAVDDREVCPDTMAQAMCLEIAVHGWDLARAVGSGRPIPPLLATEALAIAADLVADDIRAELFAPAVVVPVTAGPSDRLVAFLGRHPEG